MDENTPLLNPLSSHDAARGATDDVRAALMRSSHSQDSNNSELYDNFWNSNRPIRKLYGTQDYNDNSEFDSQNFGDVDVMPSRTRSLNYNSC